MIKKKKNVLRVNKIGVLKFCAINSNEQKEYMYIARHIRKGTDKRFKTSTKQVSDRSMEVKLPTLLEIYD